MVNRNEILNYISSNKEFFCSEFDITKIGIFGSVARNEHSDTSDIDLILEFDTNVENIHAKKTELRRIFENRFHVSVDICREKCLKPIFREEILNEAIYVE